MFGFSVQLSCEPCCSSVSPTVSLFCSFFLHLKSFSSTDDEEGGRPTVVDNCTEALRPEGIEGVLAMFEGGPALKILTCSANLDLVIPREEDLHHWFPKAPPHTDLVSIGLCEVRWTGDDDAHCKNSRSISSSDDNSSHSSGSKPGGSSSGGVGGGLLDMIQRHLGDQFVEVAWVRSYHQYVGLFARKEIVALGALSRNVVVGSSSSRKRSNNGRRKDNGASVTGRPSADEVVSATTAVKALHLLGGLDPSSGSLKLRHLGAEVAEPVVLRKPSWYVLQIAGVGAQALRVNFRGTRICFVHARLPSGDAKHSCHARSSAIQKILRKLHFKGDDRRLDVTTSNDHVVWCGDLNYRFTVPQHWAKAYRVSVVRSLINAKDFNALYDYDQLRREILSGRALSAFKMCRPRFPPTFRVLQERGYSYYDLEPDPRGTYNDAARTDARQQQQQQQQRGGETTTGAGAATCCGVGFDDDGDDAGGSGDGVGGHTGFGNVGVLHGSALHAYRGRRLRLGFGVAHMGRSELLKAQGGLALKVTHRVHVPSAPPLNGLVTSRVYGQGRPCAGAQPTRAGD